MPLEGTQEWNFVKCCPYWLVSYSAILNKNLFISILLFSSCSDTRFGSTSQFEWPFNAVADFRAYQCVSSPQRERAYLLGSCSGSSGLGQRVRMCLWGKGRVENQWRRGDSSFSHPSSAGQHCREGLYTLQCTTAALHAPAQTHRQMNRWEGVLLAPI